MQTDGINYKRLKLSKTVFNKFYNAYVQILQDKKSSIDTKTMQLETLLHRKKDPYKILYLAIFITSIQSIEINYNRLYKAVDCYCLQHEFVKLLSWYMFQKSYISQEDTKLENIDAFNGATRLVSIIYASYLFVHGTNTKDITPMFEASWEKLLETGININPYIFVHAIIEIIMHTSNLVQSLINSPLHTMHEKGNEEVEKAEEESKQQVIH